MKRLSVFAAAAREFCEFIDRLGADDGRLSYRRLESLLARLHTAILPVAEEMSDEEDSSFDHLSLSQEQYWEILDRIGPAVRPGVDALVEHFGEDDPEGADRACLFFDDLADLYRDLHRGLAAWESGSPAGKVDAAWEWRFNYESHWGGHLFRAMLTVHDALYLVYADGEP